MKFTAFKEFRAGHELAIREVTKYLAGELAAVLRELRSGLSSLTFSDNFESFEVELEIAAASESEVRNQFRGGVIPSRWIAVRKDQYGIYVCDGDTEWTKDYVYLKNTHATQAATLTVVFFR